MRTLVTNTIVLAAVVVLGSRLSAAESALPAAPAIGPWLAKHCGDCHAGGSKEGGVSLEGIAAFNDAKPDVWAAIHGQLQLSLMPPADAEQPSAAERAEIVAWVANAMRAAGQHVTDKLALPNYGNFVPHEPLFRGPAHPAPATPFRAWRVRPEVYAARVPGATQPFALLPAQQIADYATLYEVDESAAEVVLSNAQAAVAAWTMTVKKDGRMVPAPGAEPGMVALLDAAVDPATGPLEAAVKTAADRAVGRPLSAEELTGIMAVYTKAAAAHGREKAVHAALAAPFVLPDAYFRLEVGADEPDEHGRRRLSKEGIVAALGQTLSGGRSPVLQAVLANPQATLASRNDVAVLVRRLLESGGRFGVNDRVARFFDEYFDYRKAIDVFKEGGFGGRAYEAVDQTAQLVARIVAEDRDVFRRLLTTREAFVAGAGHGFPNYVAYGFPPDSKVSGLVTLDPVRRCGILTQLSWLVAHSGNFHNDPVRRGKWVLTHLIGGTVPDVPVTVCAMVPDDPTRTLRDRFRVVSDDSYCWKCHYRMNQLGMPFEAYDHFGRHRLQELDKPVDSSGAVVDSGVPELDGPVKDAVELIERLATSQRAEEMFVRYAFRFFLGRNETLRDAKTLRDAHAAYVQSEGSMKALVASLLSSDSFLYRFDAAPRP